MQQKIEKIDNALNKCVKYPVNVIIFVALIMMLGTLGIFMWEHKPSMGEVFDALFVLAIILLVLVASAVWFDLCGRYAKVRIATKAFWAVVFTTIAGYMVYCLIKWIISLVGA